MIARATRALRRTRTLAAVFSGCAALAAASQAASADGSSFELLGGMNLSSPRTAASISLASFTGLIGGFGFDIHVKDHLYEDLNILYVARRYSANYTLPTIMIPLLTKFEWGPITMGVGPYVALILGASSDLGAETTPADLGISQTDFGVVLDGGLKVPLTKTINGFGEVRVSRALSAAYGGANAFYWSQIQALVGIQIPIGKKRWTGQ